ncbi:outer membrane protein assembly factor BamB family protein [Tomitella biformata]|uniref:outer membrane protein assembly factor BamB family protein n=1 Tax=Tomitella biformata TaxID=630403 RepID=UPI000462EAD5|nr:PQQ-binding-like beta-propeller repeat protein [Tomitella biformata]
MRFVPGLSPRRLLVGAALLSVAAVTVSGCAGVPDPTPGYASGWSAAHGDARGANAVDVDGPSTLDLRWERPLGGPLIGTGAVGPDGQFTVLAGTTAGCQLFTFNLDSGRKQWCTGQNPGPGLTSPLQDRFGSVYAGNIGAAMSFNDGGLTRWTTPVIGMPQPIAMFADGNILVVTHMGQVNALHSPNGRKHAESVNLVPTVPMPDPAIGLDQCATAGPDCAVANAPALNLATGEFYLTLRMPGSATTSLVAMKYDPTEDEFGQASVKELWRTDIDGSSVQSAPALSADGNTVYVLDAHNTIWALDTADGAARWSHPLDFTAARTLSVSADGLIIPAPATTGPLIALQDNGDGAAVKWRRADLPVVGPTSIAANSRGYVAIRDGAHPLTVMAIDLSDGQTVSRAELPGDASASAVTLIAPGEQLATLTADGGMYVFD